MTNYGVEPTWGIPGPAFLVLYLGAALVIMVLAALHRRVLFAGTDGAQAVRLGPQQIAYLNAGPRLAVYTALGGLRASGAIGTGPGKTLVQTGPMPYGVTPLDAAVHNAAGKRIAAKSLHTDPWVISAVDQLRDGLEKAGLAVTAERRRAARIWTFVGLAFIALGIWRFGAGMSDGLPTVFLLFEIAVVILLFTIFLFRMPTQTRAAKRALADLRTRHHHLAPANSPSYETYGAPAAAMGVALFGVSAIYSMDPAFAAEADVQRVDNYGSGGSGFDAGSSSSCSGSSSSCGGGSSSSCGGGGGGGGGCGG